MTETTERWRWVDACAVGVTLLYFSWFVSGAVGMKFAPDDPMNLYFSLHAGWWGLIKGIVLFFTTEYRPMGGLLYFTIYNTFGLDPLPYRIVLMAVMAVNVVLHYEWSRLLSGSRMIAWMAALIGSFHVRLISVYYATAFTYDVLCYAFVMGAFVVHLRMRKRGLVWVLLLYVGALTSKEMAISFPLLLGAYEVLRRTTRSWQAVWWSGAITLVYCLGRTLAPGALSNAPGYKMSFSFAQMMFLQARYVETLFLRMPESMGGWHVVAFWALIGVLACWRRHLWLCLAWIVLSPIPIILVGRYPGPTLYLPYAGYALLVASVLLWPLRRQVWLQGVVVVLVCGWIGMRMKREMPGPLRDLVVQQEFTWRVWRAIESAPVKVVHGERILIVDDPFPDYDTTFLIALREHDPAVNVTSVKAGQPWPSVTDRQAFHHVWSLRDGWLTVIRQVSACGMADPNRGTTASCK
jgi:hypothetical protein